ncbi:methyl-accepting chemotaxis protein [Rhizobium sp. SG_E_25_P2]|uniref:cache domain-containing protein n=1 Tax=Rhizobium sp. SG_E_25_P2 TaxID=2879942 RepID=UPI0024749083|nr:cache domain-containing protein [Rhizobium sp. SG_E_25_P2]MDH6266562.1 methyl-accepting chemotaxis protein [Rhizobium sp. SG_E_25_P2]
MKLERRIAVIASLILGATLAIGGWILYADGRAALSASEKKEIEATSLVLITAMTQAENLTVSHSELIAQDNQVIALLKAGDRAGLMAKMKPTLDSLALEAGVDVLHFQTADIKSFLRVWAPEDFGQDLSKIRPMVLAANRSRKPQKGLEIGLKGLSLRAVSAAIDSDAVIGTVEVGVSLKMLMEASKSSTGADFAIFLDPQYIPTAKGGFGERGAKLQLDGSTNSTLFEALQKDGLIKLSRGPELEITKREAATLGVMTRPLLDYSGKVIGAMIVARDFTVAEAAFRATLVTVIVVALSGLMIGFGVIMAGLRAFVFRPLEELADELQSGRIGAPTTALAAYLKMRDGAARALRSGGDA